MTSMHPHWEATDAQETAQDTVHVDAVSPAAPTQVVMHATSVSRRPAAFVGVALVILIGFLVVRGMSGVQGQLTGEHEIHITAAGADPAVLTVTPGATITWVNDDDIPHILSSENLPTSTDDYLESPAIFSGEAYDVTLSATATPGTYDYVSKTAAAVKGQIVVQGAQAASAKSVMSSKADVMMEAHSSQASSKAADVMMHTQSSAAAMTTGGMPPVNPYTVGSNRVPVAGSVTQGTRAVTTHTPKRTTDSGPGLWLVIGGSLAGLHLMTRKAFTRG